jgi:hypothetical protein
MFRITQDPTSGSIDSSLINITRNGSTVLVVCAVGGVWCMCTACTHTTGPEYAAKHRQRTQQAPLNHCV